MTKADGTQQDMTLAELQRRDWKNGDRIRVDHWVLWWGGGKIAYVWYWDFYFRAWPSEEDQPIIGPGLRAYFGRELRQMGWYWNTDLGFFRYGATMQGGSYSFREIWVQMWLIAAFLAWPAVPWARARRRWLLGGCRWCGYDLRASALKCPECGEAIQSPPRPGRAGFEIGSIVILGLSLIAAVATASRDSLWQQGYGLAALLQMTDIGMPWRMPSPMGWQVVAGFIALIGLGRGEGQCAKLGVALNWGLAAVSLLLAGVLAARFMILH